MWRLVRLLVLGLLSAVPAIPAGAWNLAPFAPAGCEDAIARAERIWRLPDGILGAIARVESGRPDADGRPRPWPWTLNAEGDGQFLSGKAEAIATVRALQARGVRSIDVGCLQVNLMHHPDAFASLDEAFDPGRNAEYEASFLTQLRDQLGSWTAAIGAYHSATPGLASAYRDKVLAAWHGAPGEGGAGGGFAAVSGLPRPFPPLMGGHLIAAPAAAPPPPAGPLGRGLDAYRATPIRLAIRH